MDKELFNDLLESVREAGKIVRNEQLPSREYSLAEPDVKAIRRKTGFSQSKFATLIGVSVRTIQNWEQGHRYPTGPAKVLLRIVHADPESVIKALHTQRMV